MDNKSDLNFLLKKAQQLFFKNKLDRALECVNQILSKYPDDVNTLKLKAMIKSKMGDNENAMKIIDRCISLSPLDAGGYFIKGTIFYALSSPTMAYLNYKKAISLSPSDKDLLAKAYLNMGIILQQNLSYKRAKDFLKKAILINPSLGKAYLNLGVIYGEEDNYLEALSYLNRAIKYNKDFVLAHVALAVTHLRLGNFKKAKKHIQKIIAIDPLNEEALYLSTNIKLTSAQRKTYINYLKKALEREDLSLEAKIKLCFALGDHLKAEKKFDESWKYYERGNELRKVYFGKEVDMSKIKRLFNVLISTCNRDFFLKYREMGLKNSRPIPIFIVGMPRSGTTLVEQILSSHPEVMGLGELPFLGEAEDKLIYTRLFDDYSETIQNLTEEDIKFIAQDYLSNVHFLLKLKEKQGVKFITDKLPENFKFLWLIAIAFPEARIFHCRRDPIATCFSCYIHNFTEGILYSNDLNTLGLYYREYLRLMDHWKKVLPVKIFEVQYEKLIEEPEKMIKKMLEYCGLKWDPSCLKFYKKRDAVKTASLSQVRKPIYNTSIAQWKNYKKYLTPLFEILEYKN